MAGSRNRRRGLALGILLVSLAALTLAAWAGVLPGAHSVGGGVQGTVYERDAAILRCRASPFMSPLASVSWKQRGGDISGRGCFLRFHAPETDKALRLTFDISARGWHGIRSRGTAQVLVQPRVRLAIAYTDVMGGLDLGFNHALLLASHGKNEFRDGTLVFHPDGTVAARAGPCPGGLGSSSPSSSACSEISSPNTGQLLVAEVQTWNSSPDRPRDTECLQQLTDDLRMSLLEARLWLESAAQSNNAKMWRYSARNSNSFAFSAAERLLGERPTPNTGNCDGIFVSIGPRDVPAWHLDVL